jgi:hypothetical protein
MNFQFNDTSEVEEHYKELLGRIVADDCDDNDIYEYAKLWSFRKDLKDYCADYKYGEPLVSDDNWVDHARTIVEDCFDIDTTTFPGDCLDWDEVARRLQDDYTAIEYGDTTYWVR